MNILIIPTTDWLCHPTPHRHHYLAEFMTDNNEVHVLYFDIFRGEKTWNTKAKLIPAGGLSFDNLLLYYSINAPIHYLTLRKFIKNNNIDVIYGAHPVSNLLALKIAKNMKKKQRPLCVFDFNDFFPEGASLYYSNKLLRKTIKTVAEKFLVKNLRDSDIVVTVSSIMKEYAEEKGANEVHLVTNGVDLKRFKPEEPDKILKKKYRLGDNVIGFIGTMERWFDIEMLLNALKKIHSHIPDAQLLLVGGSIKTDYLDQLKKRAGTLGISDSVIFTGIVPYDEVSKYINLMSVGVIPPISKDLFMGKIALPNKLFQYSACGKPILTYPMPEIMNVGGSAIETFEDEKQFVQKCVNILNEGEENKEGLELAENFDWRNQCNKLIEIFQARPLEE